MKIRNRKGVALVFTLLIMLVVISFVVALMLRSVQEKRMSDRERRLSQAFYNAEGGTNSALDYLDTIINNYLLNTVAGTNPSTVVTKSQTYVGNGDGIGFLIYFAKDSGTPVLTLNGAQAEYNGATSNFGNGTYQYKITITEKANPTTVSSNVWDFPYFYNIQTTGTANGSNSRVVLNGDFTIRVQKDNFAKYALFTNNQTMPDGTNVWFNSRTNFSGPMHTNGRYNFAYNPSGTFNGVVSQVEAMARFYNNSSPILLNDDHNGIKDVPTFNDDFNRGASSVSLTSTSQQTDMINQATAGNTYGSNGIYIPNSAGALTGGVYVKGNASVNMSVDGSNNAVYTVTQSGTTKTITVNKVTNQTTVAISGGGGTTTYSGIPDGVDDVGTLVYVDGAITGLAGTVQGDTDVTIASQNDITITNNVKYQNYTAGVGTPGTVGYVPPNADGQANLLGLVTWGGNVYVGNSAPDDVEIHGTILAKNGIFQVDDYNDTGVGPRGVATLLGGAITDDYGAFGTFNSSTGAHVSGYGRNFVYDERMMTSSPPYFPTLNTFIAFTNDLTDKLTWQGGN